MKATAGIAAFLLAAAASQAAAEGVRVIGNVRVDAASIAAQVPVEPGRKAAEWQLDEAVKTLFATGQFDDVRAENVKDGVVVTVVERPLVQSVRFQGNSRLKDAALMSAAGISSGQTWKHEDAQAISSAVSQAYAAAARPDAVTRVKAEPAGTGRVEVFVEIEEGDRIGVDDVWFKGNESFPESRLRSVITTKESGWLSWFRNSDAYDPAKVEADAEALLAFYRSQGYADARVLLSDVDRHDEGFVVGFVIDEGQRYTVSAASLEDDAEVRDKAVAAAQSIKGRLYSPALLAKAAEDVEAAATDAGRLPLKVEPRVTRLDGGRMEVVFAADPAPRIYIQRIEIEGNDRTRDEVVRRELDFAEGDLLDRTLLKRAERHLKALGLFESVSLIVAPGDAADRTVLRVKVIERRTGELSAGGGWSTADGLLANVSLSQANILGTGRAGRVFAGRNDAGTSIGASFSEPYFLGMRMTAGAEAFRMADERSSGGVRAYDETVTGARFSLSAPVSGSLSASARYGLSLRDVSDVDALLSGAGVPGDPSLVVPGQRLISSVGWSVVYDGLDDPRNPSEGFRGEMGQDFAGLGGDATWLRTEASGHWYGRVSPASPVVAHLGLSGGHVSGLGEELDYLDHFRAGPRMVRGFEKDGFGPRDAATGYHLGGTAFVSATAEAIAPFPFLPPERGLKSVAFVDAGSVWSPDSARVESSGAEVSSSSSGLRAAVGAGVIWDSPFGTLRADFAFPIAKQDGDREQVFTFSGGTRF